MTRHHYPSDPDDDTPALSSQWSEAAIDEPSEVQIRSDRLRREAEQRERERVQAICDRWNAEHKVGTPVRYWPVFRTGEGHRSVTRSEAWLLGGHSPVVMVDGYAGGIALTHVDVDQ